MAVLKDSKVKHSINKIQTLSTNTKLEKESQKVLLQVSNFVVLTPLVQLCKASLSYIVLWKSPWKLIMADIGTLKHGRIIKYALTDLKSIT